MKSRNGWKQMLWVVLAGTMLLGCFVPIIYGGYKLYESATQVGVVINIKEPAADVYQAAINTVEKRKIYQITQRNDKDMVLSVQSISRKDLEGTVTVRQLRPKTSTLSITATKLKDLDSGEQKKGLENAVLSVCSELKYECTPEEEKKK